MTSKKTHLGTVRVALKGLGHFVPVGAVELDQLREPDGVVLGPSRVVPVRGRRLLRSSTATAASEFDASLLGTHLEVDIGLEALAGKHELFTGPDEELADVHRLVEGEEVGVLRKDAHLGREGMATPLKTSGTAPVVGPLTHRSEVGG